MVATTKIQDPLLSPYLYILIAITIIDCYFIICIDRTTYHIVAEYYTNVVNSNGLAIDPETKQGIPCGSKRPPTQRFRGKTARELSVLIIETDRKVTRAHPANYLGREFQKAEFSKKAVSFAIRLHTRLMEEEDRGDGGRGGGDISLFLSSYLSHVISLIEMQAYMYIHSTYKTYSYS
jgi:hypothetical protein